jgi:uroporphyrinogen-III synthase
VLYPASNKASSVLQQGLLARGFNVVRLNTYDTLPVKDIQPATLEAAKRTAVVAVASPSAVK